MRTLRAQAAWRLLAADKAPIVIGLLRTLLMDTDTVLTSSVLHERLTRHLEALRAAGEDMPQTAQAYAADWLREGWLTRRLPQGASEEVAELSAEATHAIRFLDALAKPRAMTTESRLATVIQQLRGLADDTDPNPDTRIASLTADGDRIAREIASVHTNGVRVLSEARALERVREIIALADELSADFRRVRDEFDKLNRGLRQSLVENEGRRGEVLDALFAGVDVIGQSDAGRTFTAFWRLLTDPEQHSALQDSLDTIMTRQFTRALEPRERKFLASLITTLLGAGGQVHDVLQQFARSLKTFVQSREFQEQRRLHALLKQATQAALSAKQTLRTNEALDFQLAMTSSRVRSVTQWRLYDPAERMADPTMAAGAPAEISLDSVAELLRQSEIDFRALRRNVRELLDRQSQASIADVLLAYPATQGFGTVIGYVALGVRHGEVTKSTELVTWTGVDNCERSARLPAIYFIKERRHELRD